MYNYKNEIKNDIINYINDNINLDNFASPDALSEHLYDLLINDDSVTGNASGSYTMSAAEAHNNLEGNLDILAQALNFFGGAVETLSQGAEVCDVTIRCYLLRDAIAEAIKELEE